MKDLQKLEKEERRFCVYMYQRQDNNDIYYIGQGTIDRSKAMCKHSELCQRIDKKYGTNILIYQDNLTKEEALNLEVQLIKQYVEDYGYGLSIKGYYKKNGKNLANGTFGGEHSMIGELNPAKREDVREKLKQHAREHNSFALEEVRKKDSERMKLLNSTPEQKMIQSKRMKDYYQTEKGQQRRKMQSEINKCYFAEHKEEHSQKLKAYFQTEKGKAQIQKHKEKLKGRMPSTAQQVMCVETQEVYQSMKTLSLLLGKNANYIAWHFQKHLLEDDTIELNIDGIVRHYKLI